MRSVIILVVTLFVSSNSFAKQVYGSNITLDEIIPIENALEKADGKTEVLIEAYVDSVCKSKGCWMTLRLPNEDLRVTFKDYGFFVPVSLKGEKVKVQGTIHKKRLSLSETKHYVEDAGEDPDQVTKPITEYRIIASGVETFK